MNLTLFFIVLSAIIGYFLYDTFKKSRPQSQNQSQPNTPASKIKRNYAKQCCILKDLHQQKSNQMKYRSISIHINGNRTNPNKQLNQQQIEIIQLILRKVQEQAHVFLIKNIETNISQVEAIIVECIPKDNFFQYHTLDGGVAILRQLGCGVHIEGDFKMLLTIKQYIKNIWTTNYEAGVGRYFPGEIAVLVALDEVRNNQNVERQT